ncbi:YhdT family protein [Desulfoplanes sp.]
MQQDPRFSTAAKEALACVLLTIANFIWWYGFAYGLGSGPAGSYTPILGLPAWFFMSCVAGVPVFGVAAWGMVRFWFTDVDLDPDDPGDQIGRIDLGESVNPAKNRNNHSQDQGIQS